MKTRKQRAEELLELLERGPHFTATTFQFERDRKPHEIATAYYRIWASSWVLPELKALVRELRSAGR